jgi:putative hydrolase
MLYGKYTGYITMTFVIDAHTHSVASGHAYSTIDELARGARQKGLSGFVVADHGPAMPGTTHPYHFGNLRILPEYIEGVRCYKGIEANIMNERGEIDLEAHLIARLDFVLAGFHEICFASQGIVKNTETLVATLANPLVDAISHPGNPSYPIDIEVVVEAARSYGKALEINDSSFRIRKGSDENCLRIARTCVEKACLMVTGSDAHYYLDVGRFDEVHKILTAAGAPEELVITTSFKRFDDFVQARRSERKKYAAVS